jgi:hypothetical protein
MESIDLLQRYLAGQFTQILNSSSHHCPRRRGFTEFGASDSCPRGMVVPSCAGATAQLFERLTFNVLAAQIDTTIETNSNLSHKT